MVCSSAGGDRESSGEGELERAGATGLTLGVAGDSMETHLPNRKELINIPKNRVFFTNANLPLVDSDMR